MPSRQSLDVEAIGQIAVTVDDLDRATSFYRDVLGLKLLMQVPGMAFFDCAGVRLMLGLAESPDTRGRTSILYLRVPDIDAAEAVLKQRAVEIVAPAHFVARMPGHELWIGFFKDSEGNPMALMAEKPLSGA